MTWGVRGGALVGVIAWLALATPTAHAAPPANDNFANAQPTSPSEGLPASASGTTVDATAEPGETPLTARSIWFRWRATASERVAISGCAPGRFVQTAVYTGDSFATRQQVRSGSEPTECGPAGTRIIDAVAGQTYRISIDEDGADGPGPVTLAIDRAPPPRQAPRIRVSGASAAEGDHGPTPAVFTVGLHGPHVDPVTIHYKTVDRSAFPDSDYSHVEGTVTIPAGETERQIAVQVLGDIEDEEDETFFLVAWFQWGSWQTGMTEGEGVIADDDLPVPAGWECYPMFCAVPGEGPVRMSRSDEPSELVRTLPIRRRAKTTKVMEIGPNALGPVHAGDSIETSAEVEVSVTCLVGHTRCIGSRYRYSPRVTGRVVLVSDDRREKRMALSRRRGLTCSQDLPNRNHHCVLTFPPDRSAELRNGCGSCRVALELSAAHPQAGRGDLLVLGSDSPKGVAQDRGQINAVVVGPDAEDPQLEVSARPSRSHLPVASRGASHGPRRVIYSERLDDLRAHEQLFVDAEARLRTSHLPYGTFVGAEVLLADSPESVQPLGGPVNGAAGIADGAMTEKNGFNCTRGRSAHANPCLIRKFGFVRMKRDSDEPLYVNLVVETAARFGGRWRPADNATVLPRGRLRVERFGPLGWVRLAPTP